MDIACDLQPALPHPPSDIEEKNGLLKSNSGLFLAWRHWSDPKEKAKNGAIIIQHGFSDHSRRYHHLASYFVRSGFQVFALDAQGHGRSDGPRGYIESYNNYIEDFKEGVEFLKNKFKPEKIYTFAHSMGALIALTAEVKFHGISRAYAISSPFFSVPLPLPRAVNKITTALAQVAPKLKLQAKYIPKPAVSHDPLVIDDYQKDSLSFRFTTPKWLAESSKAQQYLMEHAADFTPPVLFLVSADDGIVNPEATRKFYFAIQSKERILNELPGLYHENMNESGWEKRAQMIVNWFKRF